MNVQDMKSMKVSDGCKFLIERGDTVTAQSKFQRTVHTLRILGDECPVFYRMLHEHC